MTEIQIGVLPEKYDEERNGQSMHIYMHMYIQGDGFKCWVMESKLGKEGKQWDNRQGDRVESKSWRSPWGQRMVRGRVVKEVG